MFIIFRGFFDCTYLDISITFREYLPQCALVYIMKHTVKVNNDGLYKVKEDNCCVFLDK